MPNVAFTWSIVHGLAMSQVFRYAIDNRFRLLCRATGVRPRRDGVTITDDARFVATYGPLRLETPVTNIAGAHITEHYQWWKAIGPRLSLADDGLTFGTSTERGVCVHFKERVPRVLGFRDHSALTVTVAECERLVQALGDL
jgi:hypothetical protein